VSGERVRFGDLPLAGKVAAVFLLAVLVAVLILAGRWAVHGYLWLWRHA
jgi:hypothetical protein